MRIGIDGGCLTNPRGFGRFARQLLEALGAARTAHQFVVVLDRPSVDAVALPDGFETAIAEVKTAPSSAASARGRRSIRDLLAMGRAAASARLDLLYFPASYSYFPTWGVKHVVATLHDTLPLSYPELVFPTRRGRLAWRLKEALAVRQADRIITVSEASRLDLLRHYHRLDPSRVRVIPEGPAAVFTPRPAGAASDAVPARYGVDPRRPFFLTVGGFSPHKNHLRLLEAFRRMNRPEVQLVLAGGFSDVFHTNLPDVRAAIARLGIDEQVRLTGFVPDDDLAVLYSRSTALVFPSLLEGFGLPAIEAMACGTPVLFSRAGSLPEVAEGAGIGFDPLDVDAVTAAMEALLANRAIRRHFAAGALDRARRFTWAAAADALLACFDEFDAHGPRGDQPHGFGPAAAMAGETSPKRSKLAWKRRARDTA